MRVLTGDARFEESLLEPREERMVGIVDVIEQVIRELRKKK